MAPPPSRIKTALISVWDKSGIVEFARDLAAQGVRIISTGGTFSLLEREGIQVTRIDDVTGFPEMMDGRVKTLHPRIHGGILARRSDSKHLEEAASQGIDLIDLIVVNLYPFESTVTSGASFEDCIEQIDIGGPALLRSAAKNHESVTVVCDTADYTHVLEEIHRYGNTTAKTRAALARKVFQKTSLYDAAVSAYLSDPSAKSETLPHTLHIVSPRATVLRYGENPHQHAALYGDFLEIFKQIHGKELSFNNIVDIQAGALLVEEFSSPCAAIIKHTNPCGCATAPTLLEAYEEARTTDPISAFGGIVALNREVDIDLAAKLNELFLEVILAPSFKEDALEILRKKRDRRLIEVKFPVCSSMRFDIKTVTGGYLCQTPDIVPDSPSTWRVVTRRPPSEHEREALSFAWIVAKHVKSNAIVYTNERRTLGIGAGQMSRVDSSRIAARKAHEAGLSLQGSVVASDAFFPFADGLLAAVAAGSTAVIQPGGSVRDEEVIAAANEHDIAMVFTGRRHFKH
ncbi:MAG: bifunctional phosphoribosylaminoimidazolecarboxamide formyltransferase/IMP cyclohydrolase [Bacteroidota bacterium]|nr:bifunctional phosphoribosylaminoimidazolecarboxamide formyltransferase/IMP cyclohydrolase [Bacteroidota bacterium]